MSDKKQSSVDWFMNRLKAFDKNSYNELYEDYKLAKSIHEEEHKNAYIEGGKSIMHGVVSSPEGLIAKAEIYYNEIYGYGKETK